MSTGNLPKFILDTLLLILILSLFIFSYPMPNRINVIMQKMFYMHIVGKYCFLQSLPNEMIKWYEIVMVKVFSKDDLSGKKVI